MDELIERYRNLKLLYKILFLLLATGGLAYFSYTESYVPAEANLLLAQEEHDKLSQELTNASQSGQSLVSVEEQLRKTEEELTTLLESLPQEVDIDRLLANFADSAKETGTEIKSFIPNDDSSGANPTSPAPTAAQPQTPPPVAETPVPGAPAVAVTPTSSDMKRIPIKVTLTGTYPQIVSFFDKILSLPRVINLSSFSLKKDEKEKKLMMTPKLSVDATFIAFEQKGGVFAAPLAEPPPPPAAAAASASASASAAPGEQPDSNPPGTSEQLPSPAPSVPPGAEIPPQAQPVNLPTGPEGSP
jgi:Tfp pilus assembly protein PilO